MPVSTGTRRARRVLAATAAAAVAIAAFSGCSLTVHSSEEPSSLKDRVDALEKRITALENKHKHR